MANRNENREGNFEVGYGAEGQNLQYSSAPSNTLGGTNINVPPGLKNVGKPLNMSPGAGYEQHPGLQGNLNVGASGFAESQNSTNATEEQTSELADIEKYGLKGLVPLLTMPNNEITKVAIGSDLTMSGMGLETASPNDKLTKYFQSPWLETSIKDVEPAYQLPYSVQQMNKEKYKYLQPAENRFSNYSEDTLFFLFYSKPKDILQEISARELRERSWRFHKGLKVWLTKVTEVEPVQETPLSERGVYTFFDPQIWEKVTKEFVLEYSAIL